MCEKRVVSHDSKKFRKAVFERHNGNHACCGLTFKKRKEERCKYGSVLGVGRIFYVRVKESGNTFVHLNKCGVLSRLCSVLLLLPLHELLLLFTVNFSPNSSN